MTTSRPALGAPILSPLGPAEDVPLSDDGRWAVIPAAGGMVVLDGRGGQVKRRTVGLDAPCETTSARPAAIGGALVVIDCGFRLGQTAPRLLVYDLVSSSLTPVAGTEIFNRSTDGVTIEGIGRSWLELGFPKHDGGSAPGLLDWHSGLAAPVPPISPDHVLDLDVPSASRRMCSPIRRPGVGRRLFAYRRPFAVAQRGTPSRPRLVLERCGGRAVTLMRNRAIRGVSFGARAVAWVDGAGGIRARSLRDAVVKRWRAPLREPVLGLAQVGRWLLVTIQGGPYGGQRGFGFTVYRGRLP